MRRLACLLLLVGGARGDGAQGDVLARDTETLLAQLDAEVLARREGGRGAEADALAAEVAAIRKCAAERGQPLPSAKAEACAVLADVDVAGRRVRVRVTVVGRPLVLVLGSGFPTRWDVEVAGDATLARVLTAGAEQSVVVRGPKGPRSEPLWEGNPGLVASLPDLERAVVKACGSGFRAVLEAGEQMVVIGPENPSWQGQHVHADALDLWWRATRARRAAERGQHQAERFKALCRSRSKERNGKEVDQISFGEWTPLGPLLGRHVKLPVILAVASAGVSDDERREVYLLRGTVLLRFKLPEGPPPADGPAEIRPEVVSVPDTLPKVRGPCALAVDGRRRRLLLATSHDHGYLYAMDFATKKWSVINDLDDVDAAAMAYDEQRDAVFCVDFGADGFLHLHRFSSDDGKHLSESAIPIPAPAERRPFAAACIGGRLILLCPPAAVRRDAEDSRVYVIEPHTGEIVFSAQSRPWEDFGPLGPLKLEELWTQLASADEAVAAVAMRVLAGQEDRAVEFLAKRFAPEPGTAEDLGRWIELLADDDPLLRDHAQGRLLAAGSRAEEFLAAVDTGTLSPEARRRIAAVLKAIGGEGRVLRSTRAIRVLEWIESPAAEALLKELSESGDPQRAAAALNALRRIDLPRR